MSVAWREDSTDRASDRILVGRWPERLTLRTDNLSSVDDFFGYEEMIIDQRFFRILADPDAAERWFLGSPIDP